MADRPTPRPHRYRMAVEVGERFGRGVVTDADVRVPGKGNPHGTRAARLRCDCGNEYTATLGNLLATKRTPTGSCGCLHTFVTIETGQRYGRGVVIDPDVRILVNGTARTSVRGARLRCDCGNEYETTLSNLRGTRRSAKSCGCLAAEQARANIRRAHEKQRTHGLTEHPLYVTWNAMRSRCENRNHHAYPDYGGRGIEVCPEWHDPAVFIADIEREIGPRPPGMTLNRIDNNGNYEPGNVEWADRGRQTANRRRLRELEAERVAARALLAEHGLLAELQRRLGS